MNDRVLRDLLVERGLAGTVRTTRRQSLTYARRMLTGNPSYTFGMSDWCTTTFDGVVAAVQATTGDNLVDGDPDEGYLCPDHALAGIRAHASVLGALLRHGGASVLLATGHPTGLLDHYAELARALRASGNHVLRPLDDHPLDVATPTHAAGESGIRFITGVACAFDNEAIFHTHLADYMEVILAHTARTGQRVDMVIADHGMAGAAIEAGIPTLSIADVNDVALLVAHARGRHDHVLCIEDNLAPAQFAPVTEFMLATAREQRNG
jgi:hypothetical protein